MVTSKKSIAKSSEPRKSKADDGMSKITKSTTPKAKTQTKTKTMTKTATRGARKKVAETLQPQAVEIKRDNIRKSSAKVLKQRRQNTEEAIVAPVEIGRAHV